MKGRYSSDSAGCEEAGASIVLFDARAAGLGPAEVLDGVACGSKLWRRAAC